LKTNFIVRVLLRRRWTSSGTSEDLLVRPGSNHTTMHAEENRDKSFALETLERFPQRGRFDLEP
jgi:hypothetical protein